MFETLQQKLNPNKRIVLIYEGVKDNMTGEFALRVEDVVAGTYISHGEVKVLPGASLEEQIDMSLHGFGAIHSFSFLEDKDSLLRDKKNAILTTISCTGNVSKSGKELMHYLIKHRLLTRDIILDAVCEYLKKGAQKAYERALTPLIGGWPDGKTEIIHKYHYLDHDLTEGENKMLAWAMTQGHVSSTQREDLTRILSAGGDTPEFFYSLYYIPDLPQKYMEEFGL